MNDERQWEPTYEEVEAWTMRDDALYEQWSSQAKLDSSQEPLSNTQWREYYLDWCQQTEMTPDEELLNANPWTLDELRETQEEESREQYAPDIDEDEVRLLVQKSLAEVPEIHQGDLEIDRDYVQDLTDKGLVSHYAPPLDMDSQFLEPSVESPFEVTQEHDTMPDFGR